MIKCDKSVNFIRRIVFLNEFCNYENFTEICKFRLNINMFRNKKYYGNILVINDAKMIKH